MEIGRPTPAARSSDLSLKAKTSQLQVGAANKADQLTLDFAYGGGLHSALGGDLRRRPGNPPIR